MLILKRGLWLVVSLDISIEDVLLVSLQPVLGQQVSRSIRFKSFSAALILKTDELSALLNQVVKAPLDTRYNLLYSAAVHRLV